MWIQLERLAASAALVSVLLATLGIAGAVAWTAFRRARLYSLFFVFVFLQVALGSLALLGGDARVDTETLLPPATFYLVCTALTAYLVVRRDPAEATVTAAPPAREVELAPGTRLRRAILGACFLVPVAVLLVRHSTAPGGWNAYRETADALDSAAIIASFFLGPAAIANFRSRNLVMAAALAAAMLAVVAVAGTRVPLVAAVIAFVIDVQWLRGARLRLAPIALVGVLGFGLHVLGRILRGVGTEALLAIDDWGAVVQTATRYFEQEDLDLVNAISGGESQILHYYFAAFEHARSFEGFMGAPTLIRALLVFVPSSLIQKPPDLSTEAWQLSLDQGWVDYGKLILAQLSQVELLGSVHFTIWGDAFVNLWLLGALVYPLLLALGLRRLERSFSGGSYEHALMLGGLLGMTYAAVVRGAVVNAIGFVVYGSVLAFLVERFCALFGSAPREAA